MPSPSILALYAVTAVIVLLIPGPAVLYVVSQSLRQGRRAGIASVLGIHAGTLVQVVVAVLGGSYLLLSSALTYSLVKYLGAAYLVYLGVRKLLGRDEPAAIEAGAQPRSAARLFSHGMLVNVLNPKLALFFFAFLPQFVDRSRGGRARAGGHLRDRVRAPRPLHRRLLCAGRRHRRALAARARPAAPR